MGEEQRRLFRETQAVMSLLEGFSDYVMDEVGRGLVAGVEQISARFHERRQRRDRLRAGGSPAHRHGPEDGAVRARREVRPRRRRGAGPLGAGAHLGRPGDACRRRARSARPSAGSRGSWTGRARDRRRVTTGPDGGRARQGAGRRAHSRSRSARSSRPGCGPQDLERIREAAPGARIVNLSVEGLADGPVDDVEVLLRGWLSRRPSTGCWPARRS